MRGLQRERLLLIGKVMLVLCLMTSAVVAIGSRRMGWTNYWGGFVYAPLALLVAILFAVVVAKNRGGARASARRRQGEQRP